MKYLQEQESEPNVIQRRINQLIYIHKIRENVYDRSQLMQGKMKKIFDRKVKDDDFQLGYLVLKWDARFEDKGKHGKFDHLWQGPCNFFPLVVRMPIYSKILMEMRLVMDL